MSHSMPDLPGFDLDDALDRFGGDDFKLCHYLGLMIADFEKRLVTVKQALNAGDGLPAAEQMHSLAGTASALSATELATLCQRCELHCKHSELSAAAGHVQQIEDLLKSVSRQLQL